MGRKKIRIANISNARQKHITFMRRKAGIIKKCHELAILCNSRVLLAVWDEEQDCHVFATDSVDRLMQAYEAAYLGVGDRRLAEYEVEQVGEASEDLVVKRVTTGQSFCRDRYIPRFIPQTVNIGGMTISNRAINNPMLTHHGAFTGNFAQYSTINSPMMGIFSGCSTPVLNDLSPELFRPPSLLMNGQIPVDKQRKPKLPQIAARPNNITYSPLPSPTITDDGIPLSQVMCNNGTTPMSPLRDKEGGNITLAKGILDDDAFLRSILNTDYC